MSKYEVRVDQEDDWNYCNVLTIKHNDKVLGTYHDGGEPEDNYFFRDWNWIIGALEEAYNLGLKDGKDSSGPTGAGTTC